MNVYWTVSSVLVDLNCFTDTLPHQLSNVFKWNVGLDKYGHVLRVVALMQSIRNIQNVPSSAYTNGSITTLGLDGGGNGFFTGNHGFHFRTLSRWREFTETIWKKRVKSAKLTVHAGARNENDISLTGLHRSSFRLRIIARPSYWELTVWHRATERRIEGGIFCWLLDALVMHKCSII